MGDKYKVKPGQQYYHNTKFLVRSGPSGPVSRLAVFKDLPGFTSISQKYDVSRKHKGIHISSGHINKFLI